MVVETIQCKLLGFNQRELNNYGLTLTYIPYRFLPMRPDRLQIKMQSIESREVLGFGLMAVCVQNEGHYDSLNPPKRALRQSDSTLKGITTV